jgi:hypothetical protein
METSSGIRATAAAVIGSRHLKAARNGQDAAAVWIGETAGAVVVCDGCGSAPSSEVGARLGAQLVIAAVGRRLAAGASPADPSLWREVRVEVVNLLEDLVCGGVGSGAERTRFIHEHFLFTVIVAAASGPDAAVWALGDGAFAINGRARELGPFANNEPPYLAYDLLGMAQEAELEVAPASAAGTIVIATDGVAEVGLDAIAIERCLAHPDALRRRLAVLARATEKIEWDARRVVRAPAALQDDGAVAILAWRGSPS